MFDLILDSVEDFHTVEVRRLHRIFCGLQIGTSGHSIQSVLVFLQTTIHGLLVAELTLDDPERMLYFAAHRGFAVFNITLPVNSVVADPGKAAGAAVNAEINF